MTIKNGTNNLLLTKNVLKSIVIKCSGKVESYSIPRLIQLKVLQFLVKGNIEIVAKIGFEDIFAVVFGNEEGRIKELSINMPATLWLNAHGVAQVVHGDLVVVGELPNSEGDICDVPEEVYSQIPKLWQAPKFEIFSADTFDELMGALGLDD